MKQQQKPPLPPIPQLELAAQEFWTYCEVSQADLEALNNFLLPNAAVIQSYLPQPFTSIDETYSSLCQMLLLKPHPSIKPRAQKPSGNILGDNSVDSAPPEPSTVQYLVFQNTQVDLVTLKLLNFCWPLFPNLQVLKIFNLQPSAVEWQELLTLIQRNKISKLFLEFLPLETAQLTQLCEIIPKCPHIQQVYLRGNHLQDEHLQQIVHGLEESNIKFMELTYNHITKRGISSLASYMKKMNKLEYLGLAKNNISCWEDIRELTDVLIRKKLNPEELQAYRDLEAQREAQIKLQQKQKGKKPADEPPSIVLEPLLQNVDGTFSIVQNSQFKVLNLAMNAFTDADKDLLDRFMSQTTEQFQMVILQSQIEAKNREKLRKKYKNLVL